MMVIREATAADIKGMQVVRNLVIENPLPDPGLVTDADCEDYILHRGKGWVCEIDKTIVGFSIVSVRDNNVWALFVQPGYDKKGIGQKLHDIMLDWYFSQTPVTLWLGTAPDTRAEKFYRKAGWKQAGIRHNGEIRFEMGKGEWKSA